MNDKALREHIVILLGAEGAHINFDEAIAGLPKEFRGKRAPGIPYTPWRLLEHMRLAQADILDFCTNPKYKEKKWPDDYWPKGDGPENDAKWTRSVGSFRHDLERMKALVSDPKTDLFAKIPWGDGQTHLREALIVADHNAYHLGELVAVRRALGAWKE